MAMSIDSFVHAPIFAYKGTHNYVIHRGISHLLMFLLAVFVELLMGFVVICFKKYPYSLLETMRQTTDRPKAL